MTIVAILAIAVTVPVAPAAQAPAASKGQGLTTAKVAPDALAAHNRERAAKKLSPLALDPKLTAAAQAHADDMARHSTMSHEGSDGSTPFDRIKRQGYNYRSAAENVARGQETVAEVMSSWMNSPHHRANILGNYTQAGIAVALDKDDAPFWCVTFGTPWPKVDPAKAPAHVAALLNKGRAAADLPPLREDRRLTEAATRIARGLAKADSLDPGAGRGTDLMDALKKSGYAYRKLAELAASGQGDPAEVVATWMKNEQDRKTVLGDYRDVGIGYASGAEDRPFWCLILARSMRP
jgi:uncharacterized protein YkwD